MHDDIIKKLNMLRMITPSKETMERVKHRILAEPRELSFRVMWSTRPVWARGLAYAFALIAIIVIPALSITRTPSLSSLKDSDKLYAEAASLPISIELEEVRYQSDRSEIIGMGLTEIQDSNVRHLKSGIIESEIEDITPISNSEDEIQRLLEEVTS